MKKLFIILLLSSPIWCKAQRELEGNVIKAVATGGLAPYRYSLDGITYQVSDSFKCLSPGSYTLYIKDVRDTTARDLINLYASLTMTLTSVTTSSITVTGVNGKAPYTYSRNSTTRWQTSGTFTGLSRRTTYTIRVKDALGYIVSSSIRTL